MPTTKELTDLLRQEYLNEKARGNLPPRIAFTQMNNNSDSLRAVNGASFGRGFYVLGQTIDRNVEDMPKKYQHSTSPELILGGEEFYQKYDGDVLKAQADGFVGIKYINKQNGNILNPKDDKYGNYFLFPDKVLQAPQKEQSDTFVHPITKEQYHMRKVGRKWVIDGVRGEFRSKDKARKFLSKDSDEYTTKGLEDEDSPDNRGGAGSNLY